MLRVFAAAFAALMMLVVPALAGDRALFNFIGYSQDGNYAAYEEYGEWDGVGGYYSHIYIIDLETDSWVKGSPYLVDPDPAPGVDTDPRPIAVVRAKAMELARAKLDELKINVPGETLFLLGDGMGDERGKFVTYSTPNYKGTGDTQSEATTLAIGDTGGAPSDVCGGDTETNALGFILDVHDRDGQHTVHDDTGKPIPKSRGCVITYNLYAVIEELDGGPTVAILSVYSHQMEGPDRRFILVPIDNRGRPPHSNDTNDNADQG